MAFKKAFIVSALLVHSLAAFALEGDWLSISNDGCLSCFGMKMSVAHHDANWKSSYQDNAIAASPGSPAKTDGSFELKGRFITNASRSFAFEESLERLSGNAFSFKAYLSSPDGIQTKELALRIRLPIDKFEAPRIYVDGVGLECLCPPDPAKSLLLEMREAKKLAIATEGGVVSIEGAFRVAVQDDRPFNSQTRTVKVCFSQSEGLVRSSGLELKILREPYLFAPVNLSKAFNMGFKDEISADRKGGWTDQGPENDLGKMKPGALEAFGVKFEIADPLANGGVSCLALNGRGRDYFPLSATAELSGSFQYLYLLHALAWMKAGDGEIGKATVFYKDGSRFSASLTAGKDVSDWWKPKGCENGSVAWTAENGSNYIGLYVSKLKIERKPLAAIEFASEGKAVWMIVAASASDADLALPKSQAAYIVEGPDWQPLKIEPEIEPGSALDFSGGLDAPAGKYGFLRGEGESLCFEGKPGLPVRFYGTNLFRRAAMMSDKAWSEGIAERLARVGYNAIRLMCVDDHIVKRDASSSSELDPSEMDKLDYMFSCLKKRGIYVTTDLYTYRKLAKGEIEEELPDGAKLGYLLPSLAFVSESAMRSWELLAGRWMTHLNPYTGLQWKDDPALIGIDLINEDQIFTHYKGNPACARIFDAKFKEWLAAKGAASSEGGSRQALFNRFLMEKYSAGLSRMKGFLRTLGVKAMLTDQNYGSEIALTLLRNECDYVDIHAYWDHPALLDYTNFSLLPSSIKNRSATSDLAGESPGYIFPQRIYGKPLVCTEWNYVHPNSFKAEGGAIFPAYASLQGMAAIYRFMYAHSEDIVKEPLVNDSRRYFCLCLDPVQLLSEKIGLSFFLRGDVARSELDLPLLLGEGYGEFFEKADSWPEEARRLGLIGRTGTIVLGTDLKPLSKSREVAEALKKSPAFAGTEKDLGAATGGKPYFQMDKSSSVVKSMIEAGALSSDLADPNRGFYRSSTGQLEIDRSKKSFKAVTERSEAFAASEGERVAGAFMEAEIKLSRGVLFVGSLDGRKLAESERLLILHLTDCQNSLMKFGDANMTRVEGWGRLPLLARRGEARISLQGLFKGFKLYALDCAGRRLFEVALERSGGRAAFDASVFSAKGPVMAYELLKETP